MRFDEEVGVLLPVGSSVAGPATVLAGWVDAGWFPSSVEGSRVLVALAADGPIWDRSCVLSPRVGG